MNTENELHITSQLYESTEDWIQQSLAKSNINAFIEYVGKDSKGLHVNQAEVHQEIQWHIDECKRRGLTNCGILAPWGHGKTEQILLRLLDEMGKDVNVRGQLICNTDDNAKARVTSIAKYIEEDPDYHKVYPHVRPGHGDDWGKHKLVLERANKSKDGTLEAWGITTSGTGSRADLQVFDDPVDLRNAILNPAMRAQVKESFKNVWLSRLVPGGFRIYIATVWHDDDLTSELMKNPEWNFLVMRISEDFKTIECESSFKGKFSIPVWKAQWSELLLKKQLATIGARAFDRGYRQKALSDEDRTFPSSEKIFKPGLDQFCINRDWARCVGMDPFGQWVVIYVLALSPSFTRFTVEIRRGKWDPKRSVSELVDVYHKHMPQVIVVENNAAQEAIKQWAQEVGGPAMPIIPFVTGKQKADPIFGLPSLEVEFANGAWVVPTKGIDPMDNEHPVNVFEVELRSHPVGTTADIVMAAWFAREGARFLQQYTPQDVNEIISQEEVIPEVEQINIGQGDF